MISKPSWCGVALPNGTPTAKADRVTPSDRAWYQMFEDEMLCAAAITVSRFNLRIGCSQARQWLRLTATNLTNKPVYRIHAAALGGN